MYKLDKNDALIRIADGKSIGKNEANNDYIEYLVWVAEGNTAIYTITAADKSAEMMAACDVATAEDVVHNSVTFQSGEGTRQRLSYALANYVTAGNALPDPLTWRDKANNNVTFTLTDLNGLSSVLADQMITAIYKCGAKKDYINDPARTDAEIAAVTWDSTE